MISAQIVSLLLVVGCAAARTCAVVSSAGALLERDDGKRIDAHDKVVRLSVAPTRGYERHVGSRTHLRVWPLSFFEQKRHADASRGMAHAHGILAGAGGSTVLWHSNRRCEYVSAERQRFEGRHPDVAFGVIARGGACISICPRRASRGELRRLVKDERQS